MTMSKRDVLIDGSAQQCQDGWVTQYHDSDNDTLFTERAVQEREERCLSRWIARSNELLHLPLVDLSQCIVVCA